MSTSIELRTRLHALIDQVKSDELLRRLQDLLTRSKDAEEKGIWSTLTAEQQDQVMKAYASSFDLSGLKPTSQILKRRAR